MKIRTNLYLLSATFVILITTIGFVMFHTFGRIKREIKESKSASEMIKDISELNIVTYEYLMHHEKRMQQQWLLKYDSLGKLLEGMRGEEMHPERISIIESMTTDYKSLGDLFSKLQVNFAERKRLIEENKSRVEINLSFALEERLMAEVLMRSQRIAAAAFKLSAMIEQIIAQAQQRTNLIIISSIIGFAIFSSCISFLTIKAITRPINELVKGAKIFGKGDLKHKIDVRTKNEIGQLANSFNKMAEDLEETQERLEEMVEERTKELREAQERLVRQERLAVLGELAGGVGHELRNPLGAIKNAAYFLNMALQEPEPEVKETLEILEKEVATSERIISSLLDFARPKPPIRRKVDVNAVVQEALSRASVPEDVEVFTQLDEALPTILADAEQLAQIFTNIVLNAIQSMPEGGQLTVKSEVPDPGWVAVSFSDTGVGIPEKSLGKLFEPLFTTKAKGIGLGLAVSRALVESHQGNIDVQSEVGKGSTFTVRLPMRKAEGK